LSLRVDWLVILGGVSTGITSGVDGGVVTDISSSVSSGIEGSVSSGISRCILLGVVFVWSVIVNIMSAGFPWLLSFRVDWLVELSSVSTGVGRSVGRSVGSDISR